MALFPLSARLLTPRGSSGYCTTMFNLGLPELLVIGAAALLVFGPKRLPELAKSMGKGIRDFKKALTEDDAPKLNSPESKTPTEA